MTPELVQISPLRAIVSERLSEKFVIHRLWEAEDPDALLAQIGPRVRGLLAGGTRIDGSFMDRLPALEIIAAFGVGYDQIDAEAAAGRGVVVTHTPDVLSDEVADITIALLIGTIRRLPQAQDYLRAGKWAEQGAFPLTASLRGRKVGIFGLGRIGLIGSERRYIGVSAVIQNELGIETVAHLTCGGHSRDELRQILDQLQSTGVHAIMALRGDPPEGKDSFQTAEGGFIHANELVALIRRKHPKMGICVAGYPEKHPEAMPGQQWIDFLLATAPKDRIASRPVVEAMVTSTWQPRPGAQTEQALAFARTWLEAQS